MNRAIACVIGIVIFALAMPAWAAVDKGTQSLQSGIAKQVQAHKELAGNVKAFVSKTLIPTTAHPEFVKAVEAQNAKKMTLDSIKATDEKWIKAEEPMPIQLELMGNACAKEIVALAKQHTAIVEAFVMDNQGANVCENTLTSDYWQGDEAKWKNSFAGGKGGVDVGKVKFDKSANTNLQQVSLPIIGAGGKVIGAVTYGLAVDRL